MKIRNSRGDTIIEVLISMAIIAIALGAGYALSSRSLHDGLDSGQRLEAISLAQGQIEFLKNALINQSTDPTLFNQYSSWAPDQAFCIDKATAQAKPAINYSTTICKKYSGSAYNISITRANKVFTINTTWDSSYSATPSQLNLYYKYPDSF